MTITDADLEAVQQILKPWIGHKAWDVSLGHGSFVTFEFGERVTDEYGHVHGEWHLWVYMAAWRLQTAREIIASCEDERDFLKTAVKRMENLRLLSIDISRPAWDTTLRFEDDITFRLFPRYSIEDGGEHWMLFVPDGNVLSIGPGTSWSYESASGEP